MGYLYYAKSSWSEKKVSIQLKLMSVKYLKVSVMLSAMACASVCKMAVMRHDDETHFLHDQQKSSQIQHDTATACGDWGKYWILGQEKQPT